MTDNSSIEIAMLQPPPWAALKTFSLLASLAAATGQRRFLARCLEQLELALALSMLGGGEVTAVT
jgi:hypothetical protein